MRLPMLILAAIISAAMPAFAQFYHPTKANYGTPKDAGLAYEEVTFKSSDGTKLSGWFIPARTNAKGTVIHFHGNAQNMSAHYQFVAWLPYQNYNVFTFDYRGYGKSEGKPSRKGIHKDGVAALEYIKSRKDIDQEKIFILGQSLGGAIAVDCAGSTNLPGLKAVVVESTFESYEEIAKDKAPDLLAGIFITETHSPYKVVGNISPVPLLVIHGTKDVIVPYKRGKALYNKAKEPKSFWTINGGKHTEAFTKYGAIYKKKLLTYFDECLKKKQE